MWNLFVKWFSHAWNDGRSLQNCARINRWAKQTAHRAWNSLSTCKVVFNSRLRFLSNSVSKILHLSWFCWWTNFIFFWAKNIKSKCFIAELNIMRRMRKFSYHSHRFDLFVRRSLKLLIVMMNLLRFKVLINYFSRFRFKQICRSKSAIS